MGEGVGKRNGPRGNGYMQPVEPRKSTLSWFCHGFGVAMRTRINTRITPANPHEYRDGRLLN